MLINQYKLSDFNVSEKAIWLVAKWSTPELRLPPRYKNIFITTSQVAFKYVDDLLYIPQWLVDSINKEHRMDPYKYEFPRPLLVHDVTKEMWEDFRDMYPFKNIKNEGYTL